MEESIGWDRKSTVSFGRLLDAGIIRPVPARHNVIFLQVIARWSMRSKVGQVLLYLGMLHEGHKRADPFVRGLGARNSQSGVLHERRKRADRSLGGSTPGIPKWCAP